MKNLNLVLFALSFLFITLGSCTKKSQTIACIEVAYDAPFDIESGQSYCFPDGYEFEVTSLKNEFCCCFCVCIWEGEIVANMHLKDTDEAFAFQTGYVEQSLPDGKKISINDFKLVTECEEAGVNPDVENITITVNQ